jgi:uncharacterized membrane protein
MRLLTKIGRRLATFAVVSMLAATATTALATPAAAAPTYWKFKNIETQECLTSGVKGGPDDAPTASVYVRSCVGSNYQEWDWIHAGTYKRLKNRKTQLCLMTDHKNSVNAVWLSKCGAAGDDNGPTAGQRWAWTGNKRLENYISGALRTSPTQGAVYAADDFFDDRCDWSGYTV